MKRGKRIVVVFTMLLALAAVVVGKSELGNRNFPFSVVIEMNGGEERELPCYDMWNEFYVFLPAYARQTDVRIRANLIHDIYIEDQLLTEGLSCSQFPVNTELDLFYYTAGGEPDGKVTFLYSENVGTVYIDLRPGGLEYIHEKKGNETGGRIQVYDADGTLWHQGSLESIRGRGNATWLWDKKPYSLTLGEPAELLEMDAAQEWILLANAPDPSHLRNKLAYDLAAEAGLSYSPECRWVDLYVNGEYTGLYLLTERNEIHPQRIAVSNDSFLVSMELEQRLKEQNYPYLRTNRGTAFRIHQSSLPQQTMAQIWESAENAIFAEDGIDPLTGKSWTELIDLDSWAKKYLLEEALGNYDAASVSQYFYYDHVDGKLYAGPVWDMDNSMGISYWTGEANTILAGREHLWSDEDAPYYGALLKKTAFLERVRELYREIYQPALKRLCDTGLDNYVQQISAAEEMNRWRWFGETLEVTSEQIRAYLKARTAFLEDYLENREDYITVYGWIPGNIWFGWAIRPGQTVPHLTEGDGYAWYELETGTYYEPGTPIYEHTTFQKKPIEEAERGIP